MAIDTSCGYRYALQLLILSVVIDTLCAALRLLVLVVEGSRWHCGSSWRQQQRRGTQGTHCRLVRRRDAVQAPCGYTSGRQIESMSWVCAAGVAYAGSPRARAPTHKCECIRAGLDHSQTHTHTTITLTPSLLGQYMK